MHVYLYKLPPHVFQVFPDVSLEVATMLEHLQQLYNDAESNAMVKISTSTPRHLDTTFLDEQKWPSWAAEVNAKVSFSDFDRFFFKIRLPSLSWQYKKMTSTV